MPPGAGGDVDPRRPLHLDELALHLALEVVLALLVDEVPLVEGDHEGPAGLPDGLEDAHVLLGDRLVGVEHQHRDLGPVDGRRGPQRRVELVARGLPHALADARGVDEPPLPAAQGDQLVDRVDGGAGDGVDDDPLGAGQLVEEDDLPTMGLPTIATWRGPASCSKDCSGGSGSTARMASRRSPEPRPCRAETGYGSPRPRFHSPYASASARWSSTLLAARITGFLAARSTRTTDSSASVMPTVASTTNITASASPTAISACALILLGQPAGVRVPATGVDDGEGAAGPGGVVGDAVAGDARDVLDDRLAAAQDPVDQRADSPTLRAGRRRRGPAPAR